MLRRATEDDILDLLFLARSFVKVFPVTIKFDKEKLEDSINSILKGNNGVIFVWEDEKEGVVGFLIGVMTSPIFSKVSMAIELAWYMDEEHRDASKGLKMLGAFESWAKEQGAAFVSMGDIQPVQDLTKLYERKGFKLMEKTFVKEV